MRETTKMVPFLCLRHSRNGLRNYDENKSLVIDLLPIKANLDVNYDLNKLRELTSTIKQSLEGPLGKIFNDLIGS